MQGSASTGANSIAKNGKRLAVAGGDYLHPQKDSANHALIKGSRIKVAAAGSGGYRSAVAAYKKGFIFCGTTGISVADKNLKQWKILSTESYHTLFVDKLTHKIYFAGKDGVAEMDY